MKDFTLSDRTSPERKLQLENFELLKELVGKRVTIQSNLYYEKLSRDYLVEDIKEVVIRTNEGLTWGIKLLNKNYPSSEQPFLKYPPSLIKKEKTKDNRIKFTLTYTQDIDISRDFKHLYKRTAPDLEIYILTL
jgi:hypothetical protein